MEIHSAIPLKNFTTMRLGGDATYFIEARTADEVVQACAYAKSQNLPILAIGDGSNIIAHDSGYKGVVVRVRIPGFDIVSDELNDTTIRIGAGENWDQVVSRVVSMELSGVEAMSAIPGTAGATPVQNVGAYGQDISETLQSLEAYDTIDDKFVIIQNADCEFGYRTSIFRTRFSGRYIITSITLKLSKNKPKSPFYRTLQKFLDDNNMHNYTVHLIRDAVMTLRQLKLPDPKTTPNSGSFFKNVFVEKWQRDELTAKYPDMPNFDMGDGKYKIPAGWLIEQAGLKGQLISGIRIYDKNSLVLVNESAQSYEDLAVARNEIMIKVHDMFQIQLEQEPIEV
ncbi:UDP-N-acetylmuramate dehydrogenase [Candidatus Saccharibacteria bacterium]|nr:UDP-N-acetylmuramate dehydrogenase [Candidatus Saccharibacteria bacterium]